MITFNETHTPADIVKVFPKASDLFKANRVDFCCGGDKPLQEVFEKKKNLDGVGLLTELNTAYSAWKESGNSEIDWDTIPASQLIDHILDKHHRFLHEELPALGQFVTKIFRVHGGHHPHLKELHRLYNDFRADMESHMIEEENELFPLIKKYEKTNDPSLITQIIELNGDMEKEHATSGDILHQIHTLTNGFQPPADACNSYRITYARLAELENNTFEHIHLENNILFKQFAS